MKAIILDDSVCTTTHVWRKYSETLLPAGDYMVLIEHKYSGEKNFDYDTGILSTCDETCFKGDSCGEDISLMLNWDLWEGQEYFKIIAYAPLDIPREMIMRMAYKFREANNG